MFSVFHYANASYLKPFLANFSYYLKHFLSFKHLKLCFPTVSFNKAEVNNKLHILLPGIFLLYYHQVHTIKLQWRHESNYYPKYKTPITHWHPTHSVEETNVYNIIISITTPLPPSPHLFIEGRSCPTEYIHGVANQYKC